MVSDIAPRIISRQTIQKRYKQYKSLLLKRCIEFVGLVVVIVSVSCKPTLACPCTVELVVICHDKVEVLAKQQLSSQIQVL